ncbi:hypothetical protein Slin15195_G008580 [Septoria linicola]|uniref:DUF7729 domain-containing protein n=1 Tax=Septoria linicola TaxID=215465 RepID=A0A9Q9ADH9_9PEZI|nr:hypothetical protein Slin14017_G008590 [Septoria linicola]USW47539.1 hypothetical protein Slin15195_G008580 [Septoria linicola]
MHLEARNEASDQASTTIRPSGSATATGGVAIATETSTVIPRPFDSNIGNNFTTSTCPTFFDRFLNNQTFADCLPLSLLLQTSNGFFTASRSRVRLTTTLDSTCNVDFPRCSALMAGLAQEVKQNSNCGSDLAMGNPTAVQAYNGFVAYDTLYHAGCLNDADGGYCYANAVTNASAPTSSYIYYLPLGVQLPGGSRPACTTCLQNTMAIFAQTAGNASQPLSGDYASAAAQVQMGCGPTFVQASVELSSLASPRASFGYFGGLVLTIFSLCIGLWV